MFGEKVFNKQFEKLKNRWEIYAQRMLFFLNSETHYINHGASGSIYSFGDTKFCVKLLKNKDHMIDNPIYKKTNTPEEEFKFMMKLQGFEVDGVRIPIVIEHLKGTQYELILMEELNAVNLQEILNGTYPIPNNFDVDIFFDALSNFVQDMHLEMDVLHNDMEPRNIMVDKNTGKPFLIDFGISEDLSTKNETERLRLEDREFGRIDEIMEELENFVNSGKTRKMKEISFKHDNQKDFKIVPNLFNKNIIKSAIEKVKQNPDDEVVKLSLHGKDVYVSANPDIIVGHKSFVLNDKEYFIGFLAEDLKT